MLQQVVMFWNPPAPVGQDISVQKAVLVHTVGMSKSELGRFYLRFLKKIDMLMISANALVAFCFSKLVFDFDMQSKNRFIKNCKM